MAPTMRTSTRIGSEPPTHSKLPYSTTRRIFSWAGPGILPSSSRKSVPPFAASNRPASRAARYAMVGLAGAAILHDTSNVLHHFPEDRYVGAALELFASVALMFWYVLRLFMSSRD